MQALALLEGLMPKTEENAEKEVVYERSISSSDPPALIDPIQAEAVLSDRSKSLFLLSISLWIATEFTVFQI